jgi:hypothetical protein
VLFEIGRVPNSLRRRVDIKRRDTIFPSNLCGISQPSLFGKTEGYRNALLISSAGATR